MTAPPPEFFLFFGSRKPKASDPFSRFVFVRSQETPQGIRLTVPAPLTEPGPYILSGMPQGQTGYYTSHEFFGTVCACTGGQCTRSFRRLRSSVPSQPIVAKGPTGAVIPIYEIGRHTEIFGHGILHRNVTIIPPLTGTMMDISGNYVPLQPQQQPQPTLTGTPMPDAVITHVPSPAAPKKAKKAEKETPKPTLKIKQPGDLSTHVARQLLELAQLKKEQCPITVEDYITGETAVMPCGHLFMQIAIEESFKKEPNKCPACRQYGYPTFV